MTGFPVFLSPVPAPLTGPFLESEMVPVPGMGGKHFGNLRFFGSGFLGVLSSHLEAARTRFGAAPFPGLEDGKLEIHF